MTTTLGNRENQLRACQPKEKQYKFQIINFINTQMKKKKNPHLKERGGNHLPRPPKKKITNEDFSYHVLRKKLKIYGIDKL